MRTLCCCFARSYLIRGAHRVPLVAGRLLQRSVVAHPVARPRVLYRALHLPEAAGQLGMLRQTIAPVRPLLVLADDLILAVHLADVEITLSIHLLLQKDAEAMTRHAEAGDIKMKVLLHAGDARLLPNTIDDAEGPTVDLHRHHHALQRKSVTEGNAA